ncbi:MAG: cysteine synthase family protein [Planctomycetes bacterium]|nr:cysteine synthase family protein [Planctomycetota bacterium]MBM4057172.1 cysteine synthase family protein [Planctomycetota bacterium]
MSADLRERRLRGLRPMVGRTPLVSVRLRYRGREGRVHAKAEYLNLTGSIKDRMALHICQTAIEQGALGPDHTIVEATSGNTGIAFAALGAALGQPVVIFMPDWMSEERKAVIRSFGADIRLVSREAGGFLGSIANAETLGRELGRVFLPRQFDNQANIHAHATTTGPELVAQLARLGLTPGAFVAGVGTGGTVMGVAEAFSRLGIRAHVHPLEPAESPTLSTGHKVGRHRIQGVSDEFIPGILRLDSLAPVIQVNDGDAILMAQKLARELGLGVGISSGANLLGAIQVAERAEWRTPVATIFCDDNKKYLSTDLAKAEPVRSGFMSPDVELLDFETTPAAGESRV